MWQIIIRTANLEPRQVNLSNGTHLLGRAANNDIVIDDNAASRNHAELTVDDVTGTCSILDMNSTNGTFVNREKIKTATQLKDGDVVRVGQVQITIQDMSTVHTVAQTGTIMYNRELVLESLDQHAILLYEVARQLNDVQDTASAMASITELVKKAMLVECCELIPVNTFQAETSHHYNTHLLQRSINHSTAEVTGAEMYIPIMGGKTPLAILYMRKTRSETRPFNRRDLQLAIAISYQASLTLQRLQLLDKMREEEKVHRMLMRFVSPTEMELLLKDYAQTGRLPELSEQKVTVLFSDIANSTSMAETLGAAHFGQLLNSFYEDAAEIVFKYGAMIKYLGDGILAIFPESHVPNSEHKAVLAGRELIQRLNQTGSLEPGRRIVIGVAVNTGTAMVGYVGAKERAEFNVLGDVVNVAYRMQELARPYKIIVGPATVAAINDRFNFKRVGAVSLKGREQKIQAYEVLQS